MLMGFHVPMTEQKRLYSAEGGRRQACAKKHLSLPTLGSNGYAVGAYFPNEWQYRGVVN